MHIACARFHALLQVNIKGKKMTGKRDDRYRRRRYVKMHSDSKISFNTTGQTDIGLTEVLISVTDIPHVANS